MSPIPQTAVTYLFPGATIATVEISNYYFQFTAANRTYLPVGDNRKIVMRALSIATEIIIFTYKSMR
jgi:hypothetical protein